VRATRGRRLLIDSGHEVRARDLRTALEQSALLEFFAGLPVAQWFNPSAPAIKSGEIVPEELDERDRAGADARQSAADPPAAAASR
jgi:hypothetical protein